jgi:GNAT superfamily N-acetyltransferase
LASNGGSAELTTPAISVVPANQASCDDLKAVFGTRGDASKCQCQRYKTRATDWDIAWASIPAAKRAKRLREQTRCGQPQARTTSGLVAYLDGEPVGWCAVEPRTAYVRLQSKPLVWAGRAEDKADNGVWAVTCFATRAGFRRRGVSRALARAAVDFARERGARAVEGYPMITTPGQEITWGELHVGSRGIFAAAGFAEVSRPSLRRVVMRRDF